MDALSEVLMTVKLEGAFYYHGEFSAPWSFRSPPSCAIAPLVAPGAGHLITYHLLTEGQCAARLNDGPSLALAAGDIVVFPHGDAHLIGNGAPVQPFDSLAALQHVLHHGLRVARLGGGGELTRLVCGYMSCDPHLCRLFLAGLPPIFKINIRDGPDGQWLENSIRLSVSEAADQRPGAQALLAKLSEVLFVETLRRYLAQLPPSQAGWLAGARDPGIGAALTLLHRHPERPWTVTSLAREIGLSRSVFAERFAQFLGHPPMTYLARWRLHLAARNLRSTSRSVAAIASQVGYVSEAAFNRAFKREFHLPPARFRTAARRGSQ